MYALIVTVHILVCFVLVGIVLLQQGKGADMGAVFGGSSQTLFGSSGATTLLGKLTTVAAAVFMLTSLGLTYLASHRYKTSVVPDRPAATAPAPPQEQSPAAPAQEQAAPAPQQQAAPTSKPSE